MIRPCAGCAFRIGTEANRQVHTRLMAEICAHLGNDFICHANIQNDGWGPRIEGTEKRLCVGWFNRMVELHDNGTLERLTEEERQAFIEAIRLIVRVESTCPTDTEVMFLIGRVHQLTGHRFVDLIRSEREQPAEAGAHG